MSSKRLPDFVVIGAQKCGTTALHAYLRRHPEIGMSRPKELDFMVEELNWGRGADWYRERFDPDAGVLGESSPNYTAYPRFDGVPERMASILPDARLIFMVRDPVDRVRSGYLHHFSNRTETRAMAEAVLDPDSSYLARSMYHLQLSRFLEHFPLERVLLIEQDELRSRRRETLESTYRFLGVRDGFWHKSFEVERLASAPRGRRTRLGRFLAARLEPKTWRRVRGSRLLVRPYEPPPFEDALRDEIAARLADDAAAFRELTGRGFEAWSV